MLYRIRAEIEAWWHGLYSLLVVLWRCERPHRQVRWSDERGLRSLSCSYGRIHYVRSDVNSEDVPDFDQVKSKILGDA